VYAERVPRAGAVYASALLASGRVYYVGRNGRTHVVAANPRFELLATNDLGDGGEFDATPAVADGRLLIRSNKALYCIGTK
jgi:outer membrane protein assembly factor BamB